MAELLEDHHDDLLHADDLERDLERALNLSELRRRRFRTIAQIAGLMNRGFLAPAKAQDNSRSVPHCWWSSSVMNRAICWNRRRKSSTSNEISKPGGPEAGVSPY